MFTISRRDFLNGVALTVAAGLTPAAQIAAAPGRYPPALTGLRGQHPGSFETAHAQARDPARFPLDGLPIEERYDLVVVGAGISGLAAAWFYRRAAGPSARILVLDNHDDFGGHARRNEFTFDGRLVIGYGGSESIDSPKTHYSDVAKGLLRDLGVEVARFETAFERTFYSSLGLSRGLFFPREAFGRDLLVAGEPPAGGTDELTRRLANARPLAEFVAEFPISQASKAQLLALYDGARDPLAGRTVAEKVEILKRTSYRDYLTGVCGLSEQAANCFQGRTLGFFGLGCDAVPAADARDLGYPGFDGLGLAGAGRPARALYLSFPRRQRLARPPAGARAHSGCRARPRHGRRGPGGVRLRQARPGPPAVRIRLDSTCVDVRNAGGEVHLGYVRAGVPHRLAAKHAVLACFHMVIPHIMPELPARAARGAGAQRQDADRLHQRARARLAAMGGARRARHFRADVVPQPRQARFSREPRRLPPSARSGASPCACTSSTSRAPQPGLDARAQFRIGQAKLLAMTFADFEDRIRDELDRMLGPGGFSSARDIAAITVNRWPHGYGYVANSLFDDDDYETVLDRARQQAGRVAIANSDAGGDAYAHLAIDQAARAVRELTT